VVSDQDSRAEIARMTRELREGAARVVERHAVTETQTVDLAAWLTGIWDEEERLAKRAGDWLTAPEIDNYGHLTVPSAWMLARIAADRKILAEYVARDNDADLMLGPDCQRQREWAGLRLAIRLKAEQYADRPGFQEAWR
jgi:hypothetical protein